MRRTSIYALVLICTVLVCGCREKKKISEMSDEEKIAISVAGESSLSASDHIRQAETRKAILDRVGKTREAEATLKDVLDRAESVLDEASLAQLKAAEEKWEHQGRGVDINRLVKTGIPAADAFSVALKNHADWLERRVSYAMLINHPGEFGGLYRADADRLLEVYDMGDGRINVVLSIGSVEPTLFTATGVFEGNQVKLVSGYDESAAVTVIRTGDDSLIMEPADSFAQSSIARIAALMEGSYTRVKAGEMDVFAQ